MPDPSFIRFPSNNEWYHLFHSGIISARALSSFRVTDCVRVSVGAAANTGNDFDSSFLPSSVHSSLSNLNLLDSLTPSDVDIVLTDFLVGFFISRYLKWQC